MTPTPFERAVLSAYVRRVLPESPRFHPAKALRIHFRFPVIERALNEIRASRRTSPFATPARWPAILPQA